MAHSPAEHFYHPEIFKTKFCQSYSDKANRCEYGDYCCFAHNDTELQIDLIDKYEHDLDFYIFHFKTVWCPYPNEHARDECVFAHNF